MHAHSTSLPRIVASTSAIGLVLASSGFGAVYAYHVGIQHGTLLAGLTIVMALALEGIKPLAISASLSAFQSWSFVRGSLLLLLGLLSVAYSLTSELTLMASNRGDIAAHRSQAIDQLAMAKERYDRSKAELATLKPSRTVQELEPLLTTCRGCIALEAEMGRAKRRQDLELVMLSASAEIMKAPPVASSDPGSQALSTYLGALGIRVSTEVVFQWLTLIPVLALEVGSALAGLLVVPRVSHSDSSENPEYLPPTTVKDTVAEALLSHLKTRGFLDGSHRALAKQLGADRNAVGRAIEEIKKGNRAIVTSTKRGTRLALIA